MIFKGTCPKCGNTTIAGPHRVHADQSHTKIDLPGIMTATLDAYTCADCGYTEFYVDRMGLKNIKDVGRFLSKRTDRADYSTKWCSSCGSAIPLEEHFCPECGYQIEW